MSGSDSPTPYEVTSKGIQLSGGDTFKEGGHVNIKWKKADGSESSAGIHFESLRSAS